MADTNEKQGAEMGANAGAAAGAAADQMRDGMQRAQGAFSEQVVEPAKRSAGVADFDDLISWTRALLEQPGMGEWVRYKLDRKTDHILVDESQDTNRDQWAIIEALAGEYFSGSSEAERRTGQSASSRIRCAELPSRNLPTRLRWRSPMTMSVASASCVTLRRCSLGSE